MPKIIEKTTIDESINRLVRAYQPEEIYLFGSYAWGEPTEDSDLDILIVVSESDDKFYKRPIKGYSSLEGLHIPEDIIIYTRAEFEERAKQKGTLCYRIKREGRKVYESL